jgi:hypothetical protein
MARGFVCDRSARRGSRRILKPLDAGQMRSPVYAGQLSRIARQTPSRMFRSFHAVGEGGARNFQQAVEFASFRELGGKCCACFCRGLSEVVP